MQPTSSLLIRGTEEAKEENLLFGYSSTPSPQASPKGREGLLTRPWRPVLDRLRAAFGFSDTTSSRIAEHLKFSQNLPKRLIEEFDHGTVVGLFLFAG